MESVESIAAKIAHEDLVYLDYSPPVYQQVDRMALERAIAAALTAERAKFAAFADEKGEPRKVLGALPVTADGYIVGMNGEEIGTTVFIPRTWNDGTRSVIAKKFCAYLPSTDPLSSFYSTKQAAEAAAGVSK